MLIRRYTKAHWEKKSEMAGDEICNFLNMKLIQKPAQMEFLYQLVFLMMSSIV